MNKSDLMEMALERLVGDMDDMEGDSAMSHSVEDCPDPLGCKMHDGESGDAITEGKGGGVEAEIKKLGEGMPSMKGAPAGSPGEGEEKEGSAEDGLSAEEADELRKILSK